MQWTLDILSINSYGIIGTGTITQLLELELDLEVQ